MTIRWFIGLSPGTTADGVDAALLETEGVGLALRVRRLHAAHQPYPADLRELLRRFGGATTAAAIRQMSLAHRLLGDTFATAARRVADGASFSLLQVQCLGCPGHSTWHEPEGRFPSSLTLGMTAVVAERTGLTVVNDLAARDLVVGGQGVPLTALGDWILFRDAAESRALIHLGGTASIVYLPAGEQLRGVIGFQAGPCSLMLDGLIRRLTSGKEPFDSGGKHAVQGRCLEPLLQRWLSSPALRKPPPRTLTPLAFGEEFVEQTIVEAHDGNWWLIDVGCSATHFVARVVTTALQKFLPALPARVLLSGGGVRNGLLWRLLEQGLTGMSLERTDRHGVPAGARSAAAMGVLAALTVDGVPANVPSVTGATGSRLLGSITPGSPSNWARCLAWMATQTAHLRGQHSDPLAA